MSDPFAHLNFYIAYSDLDSTQPPVIGTFIKPHKGFLKDHHVYHNVRKEFCFTKEQADTEWQTAIEEYCSLVRNTCRIPAPKLLIIPKADIEAYEAELAAKRAAMAHKAPEAKAAPTPAPVIEAPAEPALPEPVEESAIEPEADIDYAEIYPAEEIIEDDDGNEFEVISVSGSIATCYVLTATGKRSKSGGKDKTAEIDLTNL